MGIIEQKAIKWGLITFLGLGAYFSIMKMFGLVHELEFRALNAFIMAGGCYMAIKEFKYHKDSEFDYFKGIGTGLLTGLIASLTFSLFGIIYLLFINPSFMQVLIENEPLGRYLNPYLASFQIFIEGTASAFGISYALMQYLKTPIIYKISNG